jgi:hypothetical protein
MSDKYEPTDYSVNEEHLSAEDQVILNTIPDRAGLDISDYKKGAELFALGIKQSNKISTSNSSWVIGLAQNVHPECEGINIDIADTVESILEAQIAYIISDKCPPVYRMSPKEFALTGGNALSSAWRKLKGALEYADADIMGEQDTIKKCDSFRNMKRKEAEVEAEKERKDLAQRDAAIALIKRTLPDFDPETTPDAETLIKNAVEERAQAAANRAAKHTTPAASAHTVDAVLGNLTFEEKCVKLGLNEWEMECLELGKMMTELCKSKTAELDNEEEAEIQLGELIMSWQLTVDERLSRSQDKVKELLTPKAA